MAQNPGSWPALNETAPKPPPKEKDSPQLKDQKKVVTLTMKIHNLLFTVNHVQL